MAKKWEPKAKDFVSVCSVTGIVSDTYPPDAVLMILHLGVKRTETTMMATINMRRATKSNVVAWLVGEFSNDPAEVMRLIYERKIVEQFLRLLIKRDSDVMQTMYRVSPTLVTAMVTDGVITEEQLNNFIKRFAYLYNEPLYKRVQKQIKTQKGKE